MPVTGTFKAVFFVVRVLMLVSHHLSEPRLAPKTHLPMVREEELQAQQLLETQRQGEPTGGGRDGWAE